MGGSTHLICFPHTHPQTMGMQVGIYDLIPLMCGMNVLIPFCPSVVIDLPELIDITRKIFGARFFHMARNCQ